MGNRVVIALGGNALGNSPAEQLDLIKNTGKAIVDLIEGGHEVVITHGNGPQVGMIKVATDFSANKGGGTPEVPFPEASAMSQGYIGYHLQQALENEFTKRKLNKPCVSVITQTLVNADDEAFSNPTKPVGAFFSEEEAKKIEAETGHKFVEDSGRGWRWVVASPVPEKIVEAETIQQLVESGVVVISTGGGGIPVVDHDGVLEGVPAVIDKDRSAALMADQIGADKLVILTAVEKVAINFNKPDQQELSEMTVAEAQRHIADGQFAPGSMLPKIEACLNFVEGHADRTAIVTSLEKAGDAISGTAGTSITA
ncbi:carbamate kinase [Corynebacterium tapiri]|uniref:Carbamate kinase n=1 Tax=Corynebacterium tapiri TaxID=1448266 RepID=A0A5C4U797_9CORY|nr:carbamate kinase [Corynebacterium tapiri]TNL99857.1 carbamate kinase [Corynebacterium tapiri]